MLKFLVLIVALVITTGCFYISGSQAAEDPGEVSKEEKWSSYVVQIYYWAIDKVLTFSETKTGRTLLDLSYNVSQRLDDLQQEFPPDIQQTLELVGELAGAIWRKSNHAAEELYGRQDLGEPLASVMSHYFDPVREMVEICLEPFRPTLDYMLNEKLPKELNILDAPFSFYFKRLQDTQTSLQPFANQVHTYFRQMVEALHKNLKPYLKPILDESEKYKMEAREWSLTSIFPPNT
uniref:Uncharacterized protein isoform X1 n=1 Tax=Pogona vitticeps TaxID=103695 RepID=A0A6J0V5J5_9SAUR